MFLSFLNAVFLFTSTPSSVNVYVVRCHILYAKKNGISPSMAISKRSVASTNINAKTADPMADLTNCTE